MVGVTYNVDGAAVARNASWAWAFAQGDGRQDGWALYNRLAANVFRGVVLGEGLGKVTEAMMEFAVFIDLAPDDELPKLKTATEKACYGLTQMLHQSEVFERTCRRPMESLADLDGPGPELQGWRRFTGPRGGQILLKKEPCLQSSGKRDCVLWEPVARLFFCILSICGELKMELDVNFGFQTKQLGAVRAACRAIRSAHDLIFQETLDEFETCAHRDIPGPRRSGTGAAGLFRRLSPGDEDQPQPRLPLGKDALASLRTALALPLSRKRPARLLKEADGRKPSQRPPQPTKSHPKKRRTKAKKQTAQVSTESAGSGHTATSESEASAPLVAGSEPPAELPLAQSESAPAMTASTGSSPAPLDPDPSGLASLEAPPGPVYKDTEAQDEPPAAGLQDTASQCLVELKASSSQTASAKSRAAFCQTTKSKSRHCQTRDPQLKTAACQSVLSSTRQLEDASNQTSPPLLKAASWQTVAEAEEPPAPLLSGQALHLAHVARSLRRQREGLELKL